MKKNVGIVAGKQWFKQSNPGKFAGFNAFMWRNTSLVHSLDRPRGFSITAEFFFVCTITQSAQRCYFRNINVSNFNTILINDGDTSPKTIKNLCTNEWLRIMWIVRTFLVHLRTSFLSVKIRACQQWYWLYSCLCLSFMESQKRTWHKGTQLKIVFDW